MPGTYFITCYVIRCWFDFAAALSLIITVSVLFFFSYSMFLFVHFIKFCALFLFFPPCSLLVVSLSSFQVIRELPTIFKIGACKHLKRCMTVENSPKITIMWDELQYEIILLLLFSHVFRVIVCMNKLNEMTIIFFFTLHTSRVTYNLNATLDCFFLVIILILWTKC